MSGLFGTKERPPKNSPVYEALGALDELNSLLGICRAHSKKTKYRLDVTCEILEVQECLFIIQAELAGAQKFIMQIQIDRLEKTIDYIEETIQKLNAFVIPGATEISALYDYARALARRAERAVIGAQPLQSVSVITLSYLNRLSSLLYALARYVANCENVKEISPSY